MLHLLQCHNCGSDNEYHSCTPQVDKTLEQKALKSLNSILHDVEDIMIEEANESFQHQMAA